MIRFSFVSEYVIWIIASMLKNCKGTQRQRLLSKFTENDFEKVDRLMELHFKYLEKVDEVERQAQVCDYFLYSFFFRLLNSIFKYKRDSLGLYNTNYLFNFQFIYLLFSFG